MGSSGALITIIAVLAIIGIAVLFWAVDKYL